MSRKFRQIIANRMLLPIQENIKYYLGSPMRYLNHSGYKLISSTTPNEGLMFNKNLIPFEKGQSFSNGALSGKYPYFMGGLFAGSGATAYYFNKKQKLEDDLELIKKQKEKEDFKLTENE